MKRIRRSISSVLSLGFVLVLGRATGQNATQLNRAESSGHLDAADLQREAESALDRIERNDVGVGIVDATSYIELSAHVKPDRAIPVLEAYFDRSHESDLRNEIASVLVSLGDNDPRFWNLVLSHAQSALSEDPPDPFETGESVNDCASVAMLDWAKGRNLTPEEACKEATLGVGDKLRPLVDTGDLRVIPILKKALESRDPLIQMMAARGLILTRDRNAVTLVIEAIDRSPPDWARFLVDSLLESDDSRAEAIVHRYMPDVNFADVRRFRADLQQKRRPILTGR